MAVSNSDDHLRNHAFLIKDRGWKLSPMFDVNPVPYGSELSLNVSETDNSIDLKLALETAVSFGVSRDEAEVISTDIVETIRNNWQRLAMDCGLTHSQIEDMRPAFM